MSRRIRSSRMGKRLGATVVLTVLALLLSDPAVSAERPSVRLAVSLTPLSAPVIVAIENGYFDQEGIDVYPTKMIGGHRTMAALLHDDADIATASEAVVMFNSFKHDNFAILCSFVSSENDVRLLARRDSGIASPRDLKGHRIGTIKSSSAHYFLSQILLLNGLTATDVSVAFMQPEELPNALSSGAVDAVAVWEPFGLVASEKMGAALVAVPHGHAYIETFNLIALRTFSESHPGATDSLLRGLVAATDFISRHPDEAQGIVARFIEQDRSIVQAVWPAFDFDVTLKQWLLATLDSEGRWAMEEQLVEGRRLPNYLNFVTPAPLERMSPKAVTIYH